MKRRSFTLFVFAASLFLFTEMMAQTIEAQEPSTGNSETVSSQVKPLLTWTIAGDGPVYVMDSTNSIFQLDPNDLTPLTKSSPLFEEPLERSPYWQPDMGPIHLLAGRDYLFIANDTLTQTLVLSRNDFSPVATLNRAGPMVLDPGKRLFVTSSEPAFDEIKVSKTETQKTPYLEWIVWAYDLSDLNRPPSEVFRGGSSINRIMITGLAADPIARRLYIRISAVTSSPHAAGSNYRIHNLDTLEHLGFISEPGHISRLAIANQAEFIVATNSSRSGFLNEKLMIFDRDGNKIKEHGPLNGLPVVDDFGQWIYLLRERGLWILHGPDLALHRVIPLAETPQDLLLSPDNQKLYLFGNDRLTTFDTAELQNDNVDFISPFPESWLCLKCPPIGQFEFYPSPEIDQDNTAFVKFGYGELYRTTDGGQSWVYLPSSIYPDFKYIGRLSLSPDFAGDQTLVAGGNAIFRSTDAGETWEEWTSPIAFVSDRDGNREIYLMNQEGGDVKRLTYHPATDENPTWSPAWTRLAFQSNRNGNWDIFTMRLDCDPAHPDAENLCDIQQLTTSPTDQMLPAWSPDGRSIAYVSTQDGNPEIYVMDKNGQNRRRLTFNPAGDWRPAWQADNRHLVFTSDRTGNNDIYQLTVPDPTSPTLTTEVELNALITHPADDRDPTVSDEEIYFLSNRDGDFKTYEFNARRNTVRLLETDQPAAHPAQFGNGVLVAVEKDGATNIYRRDKYDDTLIPLTNTPAFDGQPAWGPTMPLPDPAASREQIAAMTKPTPLTDISTLNLQPISPENAAQLVQLARLGKGVVKAVQWSPDGKLMATVGGLGIYLYNAQTLQEVKWIETQRPVAILRFSPDGNRLVIGDLDNTLHVLDITTGQPLYSLKGGSQLVSIVISPNGDKFITHRKYDSIQLWDMQTGQNLNEFKLDIHDDPVLSQDCQTLAISNNNDGTKVLDVDSGNLLYTLPEQAFAIDSAVFSPDGRQLAISIDDAIRIYDVKTGQRLHTLEGQRYSLFLAFSPNSRILASGGNDNTVMLWDTQIGQRLHLFDEQAYTYAFAFSPDSRLLAVGSKDSSLKLWDVDTGQSVHTFAGHPKTVYAVAFSPDGSRLMSHSGYVLRLWDANSGQLLDTFERNPPTHFVLAAGERLIVPGAGQTTIRQWITATGQLSNQHTVTGQSPIAVSPDGERLATSNEDFTIQLWDTTTGQPLSLLKGHAKEVTGLAFSPDGTILASSDKNEFFGHGSTNNSAIRLWQVETGELLSAYETTPWGATVKTFLTQNRLLTIRYVSDSCGRSGGSSNVALWDMADLLSSGSNIDPLWFNGDRSGAGHITISANRRVIVASFQDGVCLNPATVWVWDAETGAQLTSLQYETYVQALALNPNGTTMAIGMSDGTFGLWDINTAELLHTFEGQPANITNLIYSPDGRLLVAGNSNGHIQLWDVATHQLLHTLKGHTSTVIRLEFNANSQLLVSSSSDGTIRIWGQP